MRAATVSQGSTNGLPQALATAQQAIHLPEVQEILRRLSELKLGIFMPHRHDEQTGEFQALPDEVVQVESSLEVSFQAKKKIVNQIDRFLPVAWIWGADAPTPSAVCEMVWDEKPGDTQRIGKHKMLKETQIYSVLSFPRRRESSQIKRLDPRLREDDELICVSLK